MPKVQTISREVVIDPSETTRRAPSIEELKAYLQGALHDASFNKGKRFRFAQKDRRWLEKLKEILETLNHRSWIYKEGKDRDVYVLETLAPFLDFGCDPRDLSTKGEKVAYIRGFFDAEGGIPRIGKAKFYIQLVQKDRRKMQALKDVLSNLGISTGKIHNPSVRIDPDYWRLFISTSSHIDFALIINSWHPRKQEIFSRRMKI